ncbi:hypothetical protein ACVIHD_006659 [Bradyrhizobium embrapense]
MAHASIDAYETGLAIGILPGGWRLNATEYS